MTRFLLLKGQIFPVNFHDEPKLTLTLEIPNGFEGKTKDFYNIDTGSRLGKSKFSFEMTPSLCF